MKINDIINETRKNPELNTKENAYDFLLKEAPVPKPLDNDIEDAIEHADTEGNGWDRTDFHLEYEGYSSKISHIIFGFRNSQMLQFQ